MIDWAERKRELRAAAARGDGRAVSSGVAELLASEPSPRSFALAASLAEAAATCPDLVPLRVHVLRAFTAEPLGSPLIAFGLARGLALSVTFGDYGLFEQVLLGADEVPPPDAVLFLAGAADLEPRLGAAFSSLSERDAREAVDAAAARARGWFGAAATKWPRAALLLGGPMIPARPVLGLADPTVPFGERAAMARLADCLRVATREVAAAIYIDTDAVLAEIGYARALDARMWAHARLPLSADGIVFLTTQLARVLAARFTRRRKCVVVDCDNTLWGGVVGEDGASGIALGPSYPGSAYVAFQERLLALYQRGVLLAVASKNNPAEVHEVLANHPHQVLRPEHFAATEIGWGDKATAIERLAASLNIGTDSLVFIDDSEYECALVGERLPEVEVWRAPANPLELVPLIDRIESLDALTISDDDRQRGAMYKQEASRQLAEATAPTLDSFLRSLDLEAEVVPVRDGADAERAAQLCQRTNQLNVTTRRHVVADIETLCRDEAAFVRLVRVRDRFGEYGTCGLAIARFAGQDASVDSLLLSCRVIGRGVEDVLAAVIEGEARRRGANRILAEFIPTAKNAPAAQLFDRLGYERLAATGDSVCYQLPLVGAARGFPDWFTVVT